MQQQSRVRDRSDLQLDLQIPTQNQGLIYRDRKGFSKEETTQRDSQSRQCKTTEDE